MTDLPRFTDLIALANNLPKSGKSGGLRKKLESAWRAQSCLGDLMQAQDCFDVLHGYLDRDRSSDTPELLTTERALVSMCVTLYVRATSTAGKGQERGAIQLERGRLTPEQWQDHQTLIEVRKQALAHVVPAAPISGHVWHREVFFGVEVEPGVWKAASLTNQTGFNAETVARLERMIPVAHALVREQFNRRMSAVTSEIQQTVPHHLLGEHVFDPVAVFGSEQAVRAIYAGRDGSESALWVNEKTGSEPDAQPKS